MNGHHFEKAENKMPINAKNENIWIYLYIWIKAPITTWNLRVKSAACSSLGEAVEES